MSNFAIGRFPKIPRLKRTHMEIKVKHFSCVYFLIITPPPPKKKNQKTKNKNKQKQNKKQTNKQCPSFASKLSLCANLL